jgi:hypothetical protein
MRSSKGLKVGIFAAILTIITGGMASNGLHDSLYTIWLPQLVPYKAWVTLAVILMFFICFSILILHRQAFQAIKGLNQKVCKDPHQCLVFLLSPMETPKIIPEVNEQPNFSITVSGKTLPTILDTDIMNLEGTRWPWQQMLRGLRVHAAKLEHVYLIGSSDTSSMDGSFRSINHAERLINHYCPKVVVHKHPTPVHFEDFNALMKNIGVALEKLIQAGFNEQDIVIDITGGQKTTSIAGAVVTFNSQVTFQYVQTDDPYDVLIYDVVVRMPVSA